MLRIFPRIFKSKPKILLLIILLLSLFLRLYRLESLTEFFGEQGRDFLIARDLLYGKFTLLGPPTSISNVHFGPFYHYFNAFFLYVFNYNPIGPAVGFVILSVTANWLLYKTAVNFGWKYGAILVALFFAVNPLMIEYGRNTFNSYFLTPFIVYSIYCVSEFLHKPKLGWLFAAGLFSGIALQANFLSLGSIIFLLIFTLSLSKPEKLKLNIFLFLSGIGLAVAPYLAFELRHQFFNTQAFISLFLQGKAVTTKGGSYLIKWWLTYQNSLHYLFFFRLPEIWWVIGSIVFSLTALLSAFRYKNQFYRFILLGVLISLLFVSLYPGSMLVHYLGSVYPFLLLAMAGLFNWLYKSKLAFAFVLSALMIGISIVGWDYSCGRECPWPFGWDLTGVRQASNIIIQDQPNDFNIAAILDGDTRAYPYRYFLVVNRIEPLAVDQYPQAKYLYIVSRYNDGKILSYPVWEIQSFLPAKIVSVWEVKNGITVIKLEKV